MNLKYNKKRRIKVSETEPFLNIPKNKYIKMALHYSIKISTLRYPTEFCRQETTHRTHRMAFLRMLR
jgi:hypothetical protein